MPCTSCVTVIVSDGGFRRHRSASVITNAPRRSTSLSADAKPYRCAPLTVAKTAGGASSSTLRRTSTSRSAGMGLQPRVDRLALQSKDCEYGLVHAVQRLTTRKTLQRLYTQRELAERETAFDAEASSAQPLQLVRPGVVRPVDDPQVFAAANLDGGLHDALAAAGDEIQWLDDHAFATGFGP